MILAEGIPNVGAFIQDPATTLLVTLLIGVVVTGARGMWVPRFIYDREKERGDKQDISQEKLTDAIKSLTEELRGAK